MITFTAPERLIVLIRGHTGGNRGSAAMLQVATRELKSRFGERAQVLTQGTPPRVDVVIDISGYCYSDSIGWGRAALERAETLQKRYPQALWVFLPQSFGPFVDHRLHSRYRQLFQHGILYARGENARCHLQQLDPSLEVRLTTDITWLLEPDSSRTEEILSSLGLSRRCPLIGIGPNLRMQERDRTYLDRLAIIASFLRTLSPVLLIPHEFKRENRDDRWLCAQLELPYWKEPLSAAQLKGLVSRCDLFVGSRYHGLLGAVSTGVPSLTIGWADKYGDLFQELGLPGLDLSSCPTDEAQVRIQAAWLNREEIGEQLHHQKASLQQHIQRLFDDLVQEIMTRVQPPSRYSSLQESLTVGLREHRSAADAKIFGLRRTLHRLEKGLCLKGLTTPPVEFGGQLVKGILSWLNRSDTDREPAMRDWAVSVLDQYFERFPGSLHHPAYERLKNTFRAGRSYEIYRAQDRPRPPGLDWLQTLYVARRSVRQFAKTAPDREIIRECVSLALQSPSACNRQAFRFLYFDDPASIQRIIKIPLGAKGLHPPGLFVIAGCYEGYSEPRDVKCPIIDASLAAMSLMLALQAAGLSSLPINFPELPSLNFQIRQICSLKASETVVMLLGVGPAAPEALIAASPKRSVDEVLSIF